MFVHFLDADGELMWTDDHRAADADAAVEAGRDRSSTRGRCSSRSFRTSGETRVEVGPVLADDRRPAAAGGQTRRAALVPRRDVQPAAADRQPVRRLQRRLARDGGRPTKRSGLEWQWSKKDATLSFRNPEARRRAVPPGSTSRSTALHRAAAGRGRASARRWSTASRCRRAERELRRIDLSGRPARDGGHGRDDDLGRQDVRAGGRPGAARAPTRASSGIRVFRAFVQPL